MTTDASGTGDDGLDHGEATTASTAADGAVHRADGTDRRPARWGAFIGLALVVVVIDQLTKAWLVSAVAPGDVEPVVSDLVRLVNSHNSGALFGLFRDQALLFGLVSLGVVALIVAYHGRTGRNLYLTISLGLLLGGALGNLVDRLRLGYVVDWVDIGLGHVRFWTFNLADAAVSTSIVLLLLFALLPGLSARLNEAVDG